MKLTPEQFAKALPHAKPSDRLRFLAPLNAALERWGISSALEVAHFLAQIAHESSSLRRLEENLNYSTLDRIIAVFGKRAGVDPFSLVHNPQALANRVYANRNGNGDEGSGDGWRYRGAGLIQLTGKANYVLYSQSFHAVGGSREDWTNADSVLADDEMAVDVSTFYWRRVYDRHGRTCGDYALDDDLEGVTRCVNGGLNGLEDRRRRLLEARKALGV